MLDQKAAGFYALAPDAERLRLEHLWVRPDSMGKGIGRALFLHAVQRLNALGFKTLEIESDPHAAGFYRRMGARQIGSSATEFHGQTRTLPIFEYMNMR